MAIGHAPPSVPKRVDEYEIISPLGSGTMGQVYRAFDTVLGRTVAVKFLASAAPNAVARERFLIEARAIARLQHPNVLSIYRVGLVAGQPYLASEYVRGQSLDKLPLPLPWQRVLTIALQLSRGLTAAHRQGVLHRDLKPANVMLADDGTAKLLDFGLAKLSNQLSASIDLQMLTSLPAVFGTPRAAAGRPVAPSGTSGTAPVLPPDPATAETSDGNIQSPATAAISSRSGTVPAVRASEPTLTLAGSIMGTPLYMAPEVWRGETATFRSDVYSLGAMLYELCCGAPPHNQELLEELALAATATDARPLAGVAPGVDRRLAALIDRCLLRNPGQRFASAKELEAKLEALATEVAAPTPGTVLGTALRRRWLVTLTAGGLLLLLPGLALYRIYLLRSEQRRAVAVVKDRRAVALVGLLPLASSGQVPGLSSAFLELLGTELAVGEHFRRVPADSVAHMRIELRLPEAASYPQPQLTAIRQHLGTDIIVAGSYGVEENPARRLKTHIVIQDTRTGGVLATTDVSGSPSELFELVAQAGSELRQQLGIAGLSTAQAAALRASKPTSHAVALLYAQGRERLRTFDAVGARKLLAQVVRSDPDYPLGHLAMADTWTALGYEEKARLAAKRAFELSANLPREDRYLIAARYRESQKEWEQAFAAYQTLLTFFPDSLDYGLYLGNAQLAAGQPEAALATVKRLRALPPPASQDPHLDILEGRAAGDRGDQSTAVALLDAAAHKGEQLGTPLLIARARLEAAYVRSNQGQMEHALRDAAEAIPLFLGAGDRGGAADALMAKSVAYSYQGELTGALACMEQAQGLLFEIENMALTAANLGNMALLLLQKGSLALAHSRAESGLLLAREIGLGETVGTGYLALGLIAMQQADLDGATRFFQQAEATYLELAAPRMVAWAAWHSAQVLGLRGDLAAARRKHEEALAVRLTHELIGFAAESRAALAALALDEERFAEAETLARAAIGHFAAERQHDNEAWAQSVLAQALVAQRKLAEAQPVLLRAQELAAASQNLLIRLPVQRRALGLRQATGVHAVETERELARLLAEATASGMVLEQFELRLEHYRLALAQAPGKVVVPEALALAQEAKRHGLGLIEKKLAALLGPQPGSAERDRP